jgi:hypothetical protein
MSSRGLQIPLHRTCGAPEVHQRLLENREYQANRLRIEINARRFAAERATGRAGVVTVPVVVHVIYETAVQNVSDTQVKSQIDVLNKDYRGLNPDRANVPGVWTALIGDSRVEFCLATKDPDGNPTTGITRTSTTVGSFSTNEDVKYSARGGADAWPADKYLNIWVCNLGGGLLGYAQFPGGPQETDGVVILYTAFGTIGTASAPFNLGRTATHEIGHWLDLFHIWGDKLGCTGDDLVADTPVQQGPNYGKPAFPHTTCGNGSNGDMFMNYMDYVDDDTMILFTLGQVVRIAATLDGPRSSIG